MNRLKTFLVYGLLVIPLLLVFPFGGKAGLYDDFETRPGDRIENVADLSYQIGDVTGLPSLSADVTFTVQPLPSEGHLTAYEYAPGSPQAENIRFPSSEFATTGDEDGPFSAMTAPEDTSDGPHGGTVIPVSGPAPVRQTERIRPGVPVFLALEDPALNFDSGTAETVVVTVSDAVTGDEELIRLTETGPDTGVFTGYVETVRDTATASDGVMSTTPLSRLDAVYTDPFSVERNLDDEVVVGPVDPFGVVFDSLTGSPINGIKITIINAETDAPATVFGEDLTSTYPSTVTTGGFVRDSSGRGYNLEAGEYRFPFVDIGEYYFVIEPDDTYGFPSSKTDAELQALPGAPYELQDGSRLENFDVVPGPPIEIDVPADRLAIASVTRTADRDEAEVGEFVEYTVEIVPSDDLEIDIRDTLPRGIDFVPGTLEIEGAPVTPDFGPEGREFTVPDYDATAGDPIVMTYVAQVGLGADAGKTYRTRTDISGSKFQSAFDVHDLLVTEIFELDRTAILGQVQAGPCGADPESVDLSGIRVYMEDGQYAVTDAQGRFSIRDVSRRTHVVQIDELTLPRGATPVLCRNTTRKAGSPISRFVDVAPGMLARVDFRIVFEDQSPRPAPGGGALPAMSQVSEGDAKDPESGVQNIPGLDENVSERQLPSEAGTDHYDTKWLSGLSGENAKGLVYPRDGQLPRRSSIEILAVRQQDETVKAFVNGEQVPSLHRRTSVTSDNDLVLDRWAGVPIRTGRNTVKIVRTTRSGETFEEAREVLYATDISDVEVISEGSRLSSDGRTTPVMKVRFTDESGIPLRPGTRVTARVTPPFKFEPDAPRRRSQDATEKQPSATTAVVIGQDGTAKLTLSPVLVGGTAEVTFPRKAGEDPAVVEANISVANRPWVLVGLAEGTWAEKNIRRHMRREDEIGSVDDPVGGRVSLFAEGVIRGEWLLTLRYDSARDGEGEFYGIDPDKDYIVYGDRSFQDNAAQSRFPLYLRLKREDAELLIGDFDASIDTRLVDLHRQVTGLRAIHEGERFRVMAFAAETGQNFIEDRIPMNGTSGPFELTSGDIISGSEEVFLVTVSGRDATEELEEEPLEPGVDYVMDRREGRFFLRRPVPSRTPDGDRFVLRVSYETNEDAEKGVLAGGRAEYDVTDRFTVGGTTVRAENAGGERVDVTAVGADVEYRFSEDLTVSAETLQVEKDYVAQTGERRTATGQESEIRLTYNDGVNTAEAYAKRNRGATRIDASVRSDDVDILYGEGAFRLRSGPDPEAGEGLFLEGSFVGEKNHTQDTRRSEVETLITRRREGFTFGTGLSAVRLDTENGSSDGVRFVSMAKWVSPDNKLSFTLNGEKVIEQEGAGEVPDLLTATAEYAVTDKLTIFGGADISDDGTTRETALSFGAIVTPWEGGEFTTGVIGSSVSGQSGQALFFGARQDFTVAEQTVLSFGADIQRDVSNDPLPVGSTIGNPRLTEGFSSYSVGLRKTRDAWSAGARLEYSETGDEEAALLSLSADGEVSDAWSVGGELLLGQRRDEEGTDPELELRFGAAHRQGPRDPLTVLRFEGESSDDNDYRIFGSVFHSRELSEKDTLSLRLAAKHTQQGFASGTVSDTLGLVGAEYRRDITERFDFGLHGAAMKSRRTGQTRTSYGASVGFTPFENGWISVGYNFEGFDDPDFSRNGYTDEGAFIQFRIKFDQNSMKDLFR